MDKNLLIMLGGGALLLWWLNQQQEQPATATPYPATGTQPGTTTTPPPTTTTPPATNTMTKTNLQKLVELAGKADDLDADEWNYYQAVIMGMQQPEPERFLPADFPRKGKMTAADYLRYRGLGRVNRPRRVAIGENF